MKTKKKGYRKGTFSLFLIALPGILYLFINNYVPIMGIFIAFKRFSYAKGIWDSPWCGFDNFKFLFITDDAWVITRNTLLYNLALLESGRIDHSESDRNSQFELNRNSQCTLAN